MASNTLITRIIDWSNTAAALEDYGKAVADAYKDELLGDDRIATGELIRSVKAVVTQPSGASWEVSLNMADYWKHVEYDTRPYLPPPSAIREWIDAKPVIPRPFRNGKLPTPEQLTFLIRRKISKVGTKGSHTLRHTLEEVNEEWRGRIAAAMAKDVGAAFFEVFRSF